MPRQAAQTPFSLRMSPRTLARLERGAHRRGEAKARTAERLIEEGLRMEDHPGIVFRDGPAGRRAALANGPDVWEVIETLQGAVAADTGTGAGAAGERAIEQAAAWGNLSQGQVRVAIRYYADFQQEIDERIARNRDEAERRQAAWARAQEALA